MSVASAETRTLKLHFIHTNEKAEITFKKNGKYIPSGLAQVNKFLRDWRRNESTKMDPRLLDLVWEVYQASGSRSYITVISAYRSPATNSMLRGRSRTTGVAEKSQHMLGKAMDFYLPDVKLSKLRELGLRKGVGGVGFYPTSGSPFVHLDVGNVRHWPRMSRSQLMAVFPKGDTIHVPSDGKPLPGYQQALAAYEARKRNGSTIQLASESTRRKSGGFLSAFFGGGADDEEDSSPAVVASASPHGRAQPSRRAEQEAPEAVAAAPAARTAPAAPAVAAEPEPAAVEEKPETPETIIAALPARGVPLPGAAPRQPTPDASAAMMAALAPAAPTLDPKKAVEEAIAAGAATSGAPVLDAPFKQESDIAFNVPLPTQRPDYQVQPEGVALPDSTSLLIAHAEREVPADGPTVAAAVVDDAPPSVTAAAVQSGRISIQDLVAASEKKGALDPSEATGIAGLPQEQASELATAYAAVPTARPGARQPGFAMTARDIGQAAADTQEERQAPIVARNEVILSGSEGAPSQRLAMLERQPDQAIARTIDSGVKTTNKGSKPRAGQGKAEPKSVAVPTEPSVARWALSGEKVAQNTNGTKAPSFAYNIVRTAPREVYTSGFQQTDLSRKANRFSGKAVEFLPVAQFNQN
ncbi:DUF882 domain-containing protein [Tianweitania populi]|nr:DUF882 domain-containing protein [Tianweitania populi]